MYTGNTTAPSTGPAARPPICGTKPALRALLFALAVGFALPAHAQAWPAKPLRFVVYSVAGGAGDVLARLVGDKLSQALRQPVLVDNKPGAGGNIAADIVAKSAPDGYTMLLTNASLPVMPALFAKLPFDVQNGFEHVAALGTSQFVLVVGATVPALTVQELIAFAKARPGKLSFASVGVGTPFHLGMELFKSMTGTDLLHVPYKGAPPALADLAAGRIDVMFPTYSGAKPFIDSGKVRMLAAGGTARMQSARELPTVSEAGVPGFGVDGWYGIAVAARTPESTVGRIAQEVQALLAMPEVKERLTALGFDVAFEGPRELRQRVARETALWTRLVKQLGIAPE